jgi:hypothetical protein
MSQHVIRSLVEQEHQENPEFSMNAVSKKIAKKLDIEYGAWSFTKIKKEYHVKNDVEVILAEIFKFSTYFYISQRLSLFHKLQNQGQISAIQVLPKVANCKSK